MLVAHRHAVRLVGEPRADDLRVRVLDDVAGQHGVVTGDAVRLARLEQGQAAGVGVGGDRHLVHAQSGADGVMVGRGTYGRPWFLRQVIHWLRTGERLPDPRLDEQLCIAEGITDARGCERVFVIAGIADQRSIADLVKELRDEGTHLLRQEVNLAKTELGDIYTNRSNGQTRLKFYLHQNTSKLNPEEWVYQL